MLTKQTADIKYTQIGSSIHWGPFFSSGWTGRVNCWPEAHNIFLLLRSSCNVLLLIMILISGTWSRGRVRFDKLVQYLVARWRFLRKCLLQELIRRCLHFLISKILIMQIHFPWRADVKENQFQLKVLTLVEITFLEKRL